MMRRTLDLLAANDGATALEYGMIASIISIVIVASCITIGQTISANFFGPILGGLR
jgi:Flp pilus assembly pilin Flp